MKRESKRAKNQVSLLELAARGDWDGVLRLAHAGNGELRQMNADGWTVLHLAACAAPLAVIKHLISLKADVAATDNNNLTPLHLAAAYNRTDLVRVLAKTIDHKDAFGWTPIFWACAKVKHIVILSFFFALNIANFKI
jgi:ankyrin repeat protein